MARCVKVRTSDKLVVNVVEWGGEANSFPPNENGYSWHADDGVAGPGFRLVDGAFVAPEPLPEPVPESVTNFQARAVLMRRGLFDAVDAAIQGGKDGTAEEREAFQAWEFGNEFLRDSPTLARIAAALGLSDAERDEMIIEASKIEA